MDFSQGPIRFAFKLMPTKGVARGGGKTCRAPYKLPGGTLMIFGFLQAPHPLPKPNPGHAVDANPNSFSDGDKWFRRRKLLTPTFHFSILRDFVGVFNSQSDKLVRILRQKAATQQPFDICPFITHASLDIICGQSGPCSQDPILGWRVQISN